MWTFPLFPKTASTFAHQIDAIYFVLLGLGAFFGVGIAVVLIFFAVRYRHRAEVDRSNPINESTKLETLWIVGPLLLSIAMFVWAATVYFEVKKPAPSDAIEIYATARQWMWKFEHGNGAREINTLHVPAGQDVRLLMTSQDVIHSFFVPAFRVKQDVLPGRTVETWFQATKPGKYHLFCAEYCGTDHARMGGYVYVMAPDRYEAWLRLGATGGSDTVPGTGRAGRTGANAAGPTASSVSGLAEKGKALFARLRCNSCHRVDPEALYPSDGPLLYGVYGQSVKLQNERSITADESYLMESVLDPQAKLVAGYPAIMPTFKGQIGQEEQMQLIAYLKSLAPAEPDTTRAE